MAFTKLTMKMSAHMTNIIFNIIKFIQEKILCYKRY